MENKNMKTGIELIAEERQRQIIKEGWSAEHDARHELGELTEAAICYGHVASAEIRGSSAEEWTYGMVKSGDMFCQWPWTENDWKPSEDPIRNLVKAGALVAAEIDRINRLPAVKG